MVSGRRLGDLAEEQPAQAETGDYGSKEECDLPTPGAKGRDCGAGTEARDPPTDAEQCRTADQTCIDHG